MSEQKSDFYVSTGRASLYSLWEKKMINQGLMRLGQHYSSEERRVLFERWLRDLLAQKHLDKHRPLPSYDYLAEGFDLTGDQVARVIQRLRQEKLLPAKKLRRDAGTSIWMPRDLSVLEWIGDQRAVRYDQIQRLLARESEHGTNDPEMLSMGRTTQVIQRWVRAGYAQYQLILARQPGWCWLTRRGLQFVELDYRPGSPAPGALPHLYWINEVRLHVEQSYGSKAVFWTPERWLQHRAEQMKERDVKREHIPDALVDLPAAENAEEHQTYEIEVERSRKHTEYLQRLMRGSYMHGFSQERLRYYVTSATRTTVLSALHCIRHYQRERPVVEIYELPGFTLLEALECE